MVFVDFGALNASITDPSPEYKVYMYGPSYFTNHNHYTLGTMNSSMYTPTNS